MKRLAAITASVILSATFATAASANDDVTPIELNLDEPIVKAVDEIIAPNPIDLLEKTFFYDNPNGNQWGAISPQEVQLSGRVIDDWVEIYTWLGTAWIYYPNYVFTYN